MKKILLLLLLVSHLFAIDSSIGYFQQKDIQKDIDINRVVFKPLIQKNSNFGFSKSIFWIKVQIVNSSNKNSKQVLNFSYTLLDYIDIFELKNQKLFIQRKSGDLRDYVNDGFLTSPTYFVDVEKNSTKTLIFKVKSQGSLNLNLKISNYESFVNNGVKESQIFMLYFGAMLIMLLYNFSLYLYTKDKSYIYYVMFHFTYMMFSLSYNGFAFAYFWPEIPSINKYAVVFFISIASTLAVAFVIDFLSIKSNNTTVYKILRTLFWIDLIATISVFFLPYREVTLTVSLLSFISVVIILLSALHSHLVTKNPNAKFFALAWSFLLIGIFIVNLKNNGILPVNNFTSYSAFLGAFLELTLLSSALAYRYKLQEEEIAKKDNTLIRQSRLASMGEMIANIAHQWRQPLHRINLSLSVIETVLKRDVIDMEMIDNKLLSTHKNLAYMSETIDDFSLYFCADKKLESFNPYEVIESAKNLIESRMKNIKVDFKDRCNHKILAVKNEYLQVILVILNNAIDNFELNSVVDQKITISTATIKNTLQLNIEDNGGGIKEEDLNRVFDPYYTTKFKKEGTGVGLYMAKMLIEQSMSGELSVFNNTKGATFSIKNDINIEGKR